MRTGFGLVVVAMVSFGCSNAVPPGVAWPEVAAAADEASIVFASEMALLVVPGNLDPSATPAETAAAAVIAAPDAFDPIDCVTATADGASVEYVLDGCVGSFGLVRATGTMSVTFREGTLGRTAFTASATDLALRGATVSFTVDAQVAHEAGLRTIEATTTSAGMSPTGRAFERTGTVTARWMDTWGCLFVDQASATTELMSHTWETEITSLTYCVGECPMRGGSMTWTHDDDAGALRLDYMGTAIVPWSAAVEPAATGDLTIVCGV